ncbi:hypothetical protein S40288_04347 [Stachybotrys chartarum IBT 40288]|nr:hypothetical protein S40288_04347 [Stachybotrys chartarum IBT 40288]
MPFSLAVGKARRPKFELHLRIYDLNNVPLASGSSYIKWHLTHSIHAEHRGRTPKCPVANHRVDYNFSKLVPSIRISIDKNNSLSECPIEFEVLQEFPAAEKITLGHVRLNLSEYVEESQAHARDISLLPRARSGSSGAHSGSAPKFSLLEEESVEEGIVRRHLMQDSKVNSTLRIGILMVQVDGDRGFSAPPLRTAPVFGGIAGLIPPEQAEDESGPIPTVSKTREHAEIYDLYRRTLAASWYSQPGEPPADECIEDIFSGGNGWRTKYDNSTSGSASDPFDEDEDASPAGHATLRPIDLRRTNLRHLRPSLARMRHSRANSGASDKSTSTVVGQNGSALKHTSRQVRDNSRDQDPSRGSSLVSLAASRDTELGMRDTGLKYVQGVQESELREDLIAWKLPGAVVQTAANG